MTLRKQLGRSGPHHDYLWTGILVQLAFLDAKMSEEIPGPETHQLNHIHSSSNPIYHAINALFPTTKRLTMLKIESLPIFVNINEEVEGSSKMGIIFETNQ